MAISILDAMTNSGSVFGANLTISAGANRVAFYSPMGGDGSEAVGPVGVEAGGVNMRLLENAEATSRDVYCQLWTLNEAEIATMSGNTIVHTGGGANDRPSSSVQWTVQDAQQSGEVSNSNIVSSSTSMNISLARQASSLTFAVGIADDTAFGNAGLSNPTQDTQYQTSGSSIAYGDQTDTSNTSNTGVTSGASRDIAGIVVNIGDAVAAGPAIANVNTTNIVQVDNTPAVNGTSFLATGGTQAWAGENVGFSVWSDTVITSTAITRGDKAYDTNYSWIVTDNLAVASAPLNVQLAIETGFQFVDLVNPIITLVGGFRTSLCFGTSPACVTGDQLRVPTLTDQGKAIDISAADGTFIITAAGDTEQTFDYEIWDANGPTNDKWSLSSAVVINGVIVSGGIVEPLTQNLTHNLTRSLS